MDDQIVAAEKFRLKRRRDESLKVAMKQKLKKQKIVAAKKDAAERKKLTKIQQQNEKKAGKDMIDRLVASRGDLSSRRKASRRFCPTLVFLTILL